MAISGHHKLAIVEHYTTDANRKKLAEEETNRQQEWQPSEAANGNPVENIDE
jgi:hypothetical protein